jgi:hypothetical protein
MNGIRRALHILLVSALLSALAALALPASAAQTEELMKSRWLGAWVVTHLETWSACGGTFTNNRVNGSFVKSKGKHGFQPGELAKVVKLDGNRQRLDVFLEVHEPILVPYQDGPFTLYRELRCRLELEVMVPREAVKSQDVKTLDRALGQVLDRYSTEAEARQAAAYNGRERDPYPDDYEYTLARHAIWQAEQTNSRVQAKLDLASETARRLVYGINGDEDYMSGFASGVEKAKGRTYQSCSSLAATGFGQYRSRSGSSDEENRRGRGQQDGENLVLALELMDRLPTCFVPVPEMPAHLAASGEETAQARLSD